MVQVQTVGDLIRILKTYPDDDPIFMETDEDEEADGFLITRHRGRYQDVAIVNNFIKAFEPEEDIP